MSSLADLDVSDPRRFEYDTWPPLFARLREESPVHFQAESPAGPFWSITRFNDVVDVEKNTEIFSSEPTIAIIDPPPERRSQMFIAMDQPQHDVQRRAVQPVVLVALAVHQLGVRRLGIPHHHVQPQRHRLAGMSSAFKSIHTYDINSCCLSRLHPILSERGVCWG